MARTLSILNGGAAALAGLLSAVFVLKETDFDLEVLVLLGWVVGPYALFVLMAWVARRSTPAGAVVLPGVLASAAFAAWVIHDAFKPPREALAGLVFLVVPLYQGAAVLTCAVVAGIILWRSRPRTP